MAELKHSHHLDGFIQVVSAAGLMVDDYSAPIETRPY
jgi:hypothetical protein